MGRLAGLRPSCYDAVSSCTFPYFAQFLCVKPRPCPHPDPNPFVQRNYNPEDGHHNGIIFLSVCQPSLMAVDASRRLRMHRWYCASNAWAEGAGDVRGLPAIMSFSYDVCSVNGSNRTRHE